MHVIEQYNRFVTRLITLSATLVFAACASTGATFKSGVGDRFLEHAPYYAGQSMDAVARDTSVIGHVPVVFQSGAAQPSMFDPRRGEGTAIDALLSEMNAYLDSLGLSKRLSNVDAGPSALSRAMVPPDVRFGCIPENSASNHDCSTRGDSAIGRGHQQMLLAVGRPSTEWISWNRGVTDAASAQRTLVITLEVGQYLMRQEGILGKKAIELGSGHRAGLPWMSSVATPVTVLQLTAALVERDGKVVRIGAEGFFPRRTRFLVSAMGGQELLTEDDVSAVRGYRRVDLPGQPIAWRVAMQELVGRVTGRASPSVTVANQHSPSAR